MSNAGDEQRLDSPRQLGRYDLLHRIASGGMATVYLGRSRALDGFDRLVAVKCCRADLADDPEFSEMFLDEARLAARIHHPNVVPVYDVGSEGGVLYLVMDYVEGDRVSSLLTVARRARRRIPTDIALRISVDMLSGLAAAHELTDRDGSPLHVIHRDVSPQNVLVGVDGCARLTDFGIAKAETCAAITREGVMKGKVAYMAPEQLQGEPATQASDVFSAGVVVWEMLTSQRLFAAENDLAKMRQVLFSTIAAPSTVANEVPADLDAAVLRALAREPAQRFATSAQFLSALEGGSIRPASPRDLASYVRETLAEPLAARRRVVVRALELARPSDGARSAFGVDAGPSSGTSGADTSVDEARAAARIADPSVAPAPTRDDTFSAVQTAARRGRSALPRIALVGAAVSLGALAIFLIAPWLSRPRMRPSPVAPSTLSVTAPGPQAAERTAPLPPPVEAVSASSAMPDAASVNGSSGTHRLAPARNSGPTPSRGRAPRRPGEFTPRLL